MTIKTKKESSLFPFVFGCIVLILIFSGAFLLHCYTEQMENEYNDFCIENNFSGFSKTFIEDNKRYIKRVNDYFIEYDNEIYLPCYNQTLINGTLSTEYKLFYWSDKK